MARAVSVEASRAVPVEPHQAFDRTLPMPLNVLFTRRYGLLPPVKEDRGQDGPWGQVGQARTVATTDGGTMRELLVDLDPPDSFSYRLDEITGPMRMLVGSIDGRWEFAAHGTGVLITWRWTLHPRGILGPPAMPLITSMWRGYARQALEQLSHRLLASDTD